MTLRTKLSYVGILVTALLPSCATVETVPDVSVKPNGSGIELSDIQSHGPKNLLGPSFAVGGKPSQPDTPSGVTVNLRRIRSLHNKEPRYFIPASGSLQVVSIERYGDYPGHQGSLTRWKELLQSGEDVGPETQKMLYKSRLAEIPWMNAARCFHGKIRKRTFPWGNAIMFLTSYVQGSTGGPVNNDMLELVIQGLTNDGRYAVNGHFEIRHPKLPDSSWDTGSKGKARFSIDDETEAAEKWLDSQNDGSFEPTLDQYESFLAALQISPGKPYTSKGKQVVPPNDQ